MYYVAGFEREAQAVATAIGGQPTIVQPMPTPPPIADTQGANVRRRPRPRPRAAVARRTCAEPLGSSGNVARGMPADATHEQPRSLAPEQTALLAPLVAQPRRSGVLLDFDGTLSPIVTNPEVARLLEGAAEVLLALARRYRVVAVLSGRPVSFLEPLIPASVVLCGLYGLEVVRDGERLDHPWAGAWREVIDDVAAQSRARGPEGMRVESKGISLTLHYRENPEAGPDVEAWAVQQAARSGLRVRPARMSVELHPPIMIVNERARTVVGVMPPGFKFPERSELYMPLRWDEAPRSARNLAAIGVLEALACQRAQAQSDVNGDRVAGWRRRIRRSNRGFGVRVLSFRDSHDRPDDRACQHDADGRGGVRAADRVRQPRQPAARARRRAPARDGRACRDGRESGAADLRGPQRERRYRDRRHGHRHARRGVGDRPDARVVSRRAARIGCSSTSTPASSRSPIGMTVVDHAGDRTAAGAPRVAAAGSSRT